MLNPEILSMQKTKLEPINPENKIPQQMANPKFHNTFTSGGSMFTGVYICNEF